MMTTTTSWKTQVPRKHTTNCCRPRNTHPTTISLSDCDGDFPPRFPSSNPIQNGQTSAAAPPADRPFFLSEKFVRPFDRFRVPTHTALLHVILILVVAPPLPMPPSPPPPPPLSVPTAVAAAETPPWRAMPDPSHRRRYSLCAIESNRRNEKCWMRRSRWPWRNC